MGEHFLPQHPQEVESLDRPIAELPLSEARQKVDVPLSFSNEAMNFLGSEHVTELARIIESEEVRTIDLLCLAGEMSVKEAVEYAMLLPEVRAAYRVMGEKVEALNIRLRDKKLPHYISRSVKTAAGKKTYDARPIENFFNGVNNFFSDASRKISGRLVAQTLLGYAAQEVYRTLTVDAYRSLDAFEEGALDGVMQDMELRERKGEFKPTGEDGISNLDALKAIRFFESSRFKTELTSAGLSSNPPAEDVVALFEEVADLSLYRSITFTHETENIRFSFLSENNDSAVYQLQSRLPEICKVEVALRKPGHYKEASKFPLSIDRFTGELSTVMVTKLSSHIGKVAELGLRHVLLGELREYLLSKEDDIAEAEPIVRPRKEEQKETASLIEDGGMRGGQMQNVEVATAETAVEETVPLVRVAGEKVSLKNLKGFKGGRIKTALVSLLGEARVRGSHHIFRCRDGTTYPISLHDGEDVGTGLLGKCLKKFGIPPAELLEQLT